MSQPLVTVVTPSYNQGHYIRATIESVLSQDYPNLEYIVMDGGSTDSTASVVRDYASRLTYISAKDRGQSHAINKGFQMARGTIVSWLNSDDLYLPGAVGKAVAALERNPAAGIAYGEGYLIDAAGRIVSRFPHTDTFNLWKLVYLSDYILQQTVYFRKDVLDELGGLDEGLEYAMDWDILIRIGKRYPFEFVPEYMGCLREYEEAKTFSGGLRRAREIGRVLSRHTGLRFAPGYLVYGLDSYQRRMGEQCARFLGRPFQPVGNALQRGVRLAAGLVIDRVLRGAQGLTSDGWACRELRYMLPPGQGSLLIEGYLPAWAQLRGQKIKVEANGCPLGDYDLPYGDFQLTLPVPKKLEGQLLQLQIRAARGVIAAGGLAIPADRRRLAYWLKSIRRREMELQGTGLPATA